MSTPAVPASKRSQRTRVTHGPFARSRNPTFLACMFMHLGWVIFYGIVVIQILKVVGWTLLNYLKVPQEERGLEARFGEAYRAYRRRFPRWIGTIGLYPPSDPDVAFLVRHHLPGSP